MKTVTILLTKYSDVVSTLVYYLCGRGYTHASLSLDGGEIYYSFNYHGFCKETLDKHRHRGVKKSLAYQLHVSDSAYEGITRGLAVFKAHRAEFGYTRLGVLFCVLGIPFRWEKHYFCSQFVAELLKNAGLIPWQRPAALYLPNDLRGELAGCPQLATIQENLI